jgi:hypothetical protein
MKKISTKKKLASLKKGGKFQSNDSKFEKL